MANLLKQINKKEKAEKKIQKEIEKLPHYGSICNCDQEDGTHEVSDETACVLFCLSCGGYIE